MTSNFISSWYYGLLSFYPIVLHSHSINNPSFHFHFFMVSIIISILSSIFNLTFLPWFINMCLCFNILPWPAEHCFGGQSSLFKTQVNISFGMKTSLFHQITRVEEYQQYPNDKQTNKRWLWKITFSLQNSSMNWGVMWLYNKFEWIK